MNLVQNKVPAFRVPSIEEIRESRRKRILIRMLSIYGDDSTDERNKRVFAVAGVAGTQEEWDELEIKWLDRTGGKVFHATDCEAGWGIYKPGLCVRMPENHTAFIPTI